MKQIVIDIGKEIARIILFLLIILFYLTTEMGVIIGIIHLIIALKNPKRFGMSRILNKCIN